MIMEFLTPKLLWILLLSGLALPVGVFAKPGLDWDSWLRPSKPKCEVLKVAVCKDAMYNMTVVPNSLGHRTQAEAEKEINQYIPLMRVGCSKYLKQFLCLLYVPVCTIIEKPILPCRSLCKKARRGCAELLEKFGFHWPKVLRCGKFPKKRDTRGSLCTGIGGGKRKKGKGKKRGNRKGKKKGGRKGKGKKGKKGNKGKNNKNSGSAKRL